MRHSATHTPSSPDTDVVPARAGSHIAEPPQADAPSRQVVDENFAAAVADYYDDGLRLAWLLCGDPDHAEDALAEALTKAYRRWHRQHVANPRAYLRRAVVNEVNSVLRRFGRDRRHAARRTGDDRGDRGLDERLADHELVAAALARLAPRQRAAVVLAYYEGLSQEQIAHAMSCSLGAAKSNLSRGLGNLRALLDDAPDRP